VFKFGYLSKVQVALGLQTVEETGNLHELLRMLQVKGEGIYTVISGTINSDHPIYCDLARTYDGSGMKVVAWAKNVYRVFEEWSRVTKRWNSAAQKLVHEFRETTFYIMDKTGSISVLKDSSLTLPMIKVFEKFDRAQSSFTQNVLEKLILETRELGTRTEELALPVGTHVYAIGEAILDKATGKLILRCPSDNRPFLMDQAALHEIIKRVHKSARAYWWVSVALIALGFSLIAYKGYVTWRKSLPGPEDYSGERKCCICLSKESTVVFLPCGHVCTCPDCSPVVQSCPICRALIQSRREIVFS